MIFPDQLDVPTIHARLLAETGGTQGLRDEALLESPLTAAKNRHHYETADVVSCAANLRFPLDPNIAAAITEAFLETNRLEPTMANEDRDHDRLEATVADICVLAHRPATFAMISCLLNFEIFDT